MEHLRGATGLNLRVGKGIVEKGLCRNLKVVQELAEHAVRRYQMKDEKSIPDRGGSVCTDVVVTQSGVALMMKLKKKTRSRHQWSCTSC